MKESNGNRYVEELPEDAVCVFNIIGVELLSLKKGKRKWTTANVERRQGLPLFIHSPYSGRYWYRELADEHDMDEYRKYIRDGNLYIWFTEEWKEFVRAEREQEGMTYRDYNNIRAYILLKEHLLKKKETADTKTRLRALDITTQQILDKYNQNKEQ